MTSEEEDLKKGIIHHMASLYRRGLITAIGGNVSARLPDATETWITPSGLYKAELSQKDLIKIDLEGKVLEGIFKPSVEWPLHTAIYKKRADVNAIVHAHNPVATGLALAGVKIKPITVEAAVMLSDVPILPFSYPGTSELADAVAENIMGHRVLLLQNHGAVAVGYDLIEATSTVEILEECAIMMFVANVLGQPAVIPEGEIELIRKLYKI